MGRWSYQFRMWYLLVSQTFFMVSKKKSSCIFKLLFVTLIQHGFFFCGEVGVLPNQPNRWNHHWKVFSTQDWKRRSYNGRYGSEAPLNSMWNPLNPGLWEIHQTLSLGKVFFVAWKNRVRIGVCLWSWHTHICWLFRLQKWQGQHGTPPPPKKKRTLVESSFTYVARVCLMGKVGGVFSYFSLRIQTHPEKS